MYNQSSLAAARLVLGRGLFLGFVLGRGSVVSGERLGGVCSWTGKCCLWRAEFPRGRVHTIRIKADRHRGRLTHRVKHPPVARGNAGRSPGPEKNGASRDVKCSLGP